MRSHVLLVLAVPSLAVTHLPFQRSALALLKRQSSLCSSISEVDCGVSCMPSGADCCSTDGNYCPVGSYCDGTSGCCSDGETCTGVNTDVQTRTVDVTGSTAALTTARSAATTAATASASGGGSGCRSTEIVCGDGCLPSGYTCCPDESGGCRTGGEYCALRSSGGYGCCDIGHNCRDGEDSSGSIESLTASPTLPATASVDSPRPLSLSSPSVVVSSSATSGTSAAVTGGSVGGAGGGGVGATGGTTMPASATTRVVQAMANDAVAMGTLPAMIAGVVMALQAWL